ncbi:MAG TPA: hypothetical protein VJO52_04000, partial [Gemmatimonadaceae bacterium]|nr:hypothetical protein [Gemmatimonadaceae bacterium]
QLVVWKNSTAVSMLALRFGWHPTARSPGAYDADLSDLAAFPKFPDEPKIEMADCPRWKATSQFELLSPLTKTTTQVSVQRVV